MKKIALALALFSCSAPRPLDVFEPFDCEPMRDCPAGAQVLQRLHLDTPTARCARLRVVDPSDGRHYLSFGEGAESCEACPEPGETFECYTFTEGATDYVLLWGQPGETFECDGSRDCVSAGFALDSDPLEACALSCD